ncbi:alpha/beta hydrolase domain-containing protein [Paenibacillus vulneris]|uniref:Alpha/beta hydrolase domain-containing protein n=1 Tax=Paenibacillus vulneris TaxID=1133364 RepID=A0ABW3URC6_9BACL
MRSNRKFIKRVIVLTTAVVLLLSLTACSLSSNTSPQSTDSPKATSPFTLPEVKISGPVLGGEHGRPFGAYFGDIKNQGYIEEEYFMEGIAQRYVPIGELSTDGKWNLKSSSTAPYKTRILVRRPADPSKFNGTVVVEWANVSNGYEISFADPIGLYQNGFAYVSVSAQPLGIQGYEEKPQGLTSWDPQRYGSLSITDDGVSYDIFTQAARAIGPNRNLNAVDPMGGLPVKKLIAIGGSQSGNRVLAYANGIQPIEKTFDALMPMLVAGSASDFESEIAHADVTKHSRAVKAKVRDDLSVPVMEINTQTEALVYYPLRQPDTDLFRSWEIAGASHAPTRQMEFIRQKTDRDGLTNSMENYSAIRSSDVNWLYTVDAAILHVNNWINGGEAPPKMNPIEVSVNDKNYAFDPFGNALGGIRLPELEVPIARYAVSPFYGLGGYTIPFTTEELKKLYPTHDDYVAKVTAAAESAEKAGIILPYRKDDYIRAAQAAPIPEPAKPNLQPTKTN